MPIDFSQVYLPAYTPVKLPSLGLLYPAMSPLAGGYVHIREYCATEEALYSTMNPDNSQLIINQLLRNCISDNFPIEEMTDGDVFYLLYWLRGNSYSTAYPLEITCPHFDCQHGPDMYTIDLARDVKINYLSDTVKEPLVVYLPKTGVTVHLKCLRRKVEMLAKKRQADAAEWRNYKGDPTDLLKRAYSMTLMTTRDGQESDSILDFEKFCLYYCPASDSLVIDQAMSQFRHGVDISIELPCRRCEKTIYTVLPGGPEFFRPTRLNPTDEKAGVPGDTVSEQVRIVVGGVPSTS